MIQPLNFHRARVPVLAVGALGLAALGILSMPKAAAPAAQDTTIVQQSPTSLAQRPLLVKQPADSTACGNGAYVSGDMAGDASPATIYANICGQTSR